MSDVSFSGFVSSLQNRLLDFQAYIPPFAELIATRADADSIGLSPDGRTVLWMRNTQDVFIKLGALVGAILGVIPGLIAGDCAQSNVEGYATTFQRHAINDYIDRHSDSFAIRAAARNRLSIPVSPEARAASNRAFYYTLELGGLAVGAVGAVIGSVVASAAVPPVSGAVNLICHLHQRYHGSAVVMSA